MPVWVYVFIGVVLGMGLMLAAFFAPWHGGTADSSSDAPTKKHRKLPVVACEACEHWDLEEGQAHLRKNAHFFTGVAPFVSPSRMMQRHGEEGEVIAEGPELRAKDDSWERFGACALKKQLIHATDKCEHFQAREGA